MPVRFPAIQLPEGFSLKSLAEENDLAKIDRVLWRGFNHPGEPPAGGEEDRRKMQSGPHFRKDLTMVAVAPGGEFVSYCGLWYEAVNRFAYVEPVATDPDYRRLGLARAALMEGIRHPPLCGIGRDGGLCGIRAAVLPCVGVHKGVHGELLAEDAVKDDRV